MFNLIQGTAAKARNVATWANSKVGAAVALGVAAASAAQAQTTPALPDASAQLAQITTSIGGYASVMFAIALAAVGILIGVKWIKRGKSAA